MGTQRRFCWIDQLERSLELGPGRSPETDVRERPPAPEMEIQPARSQPGALREQIQCLQRSEVETRGLLERERCGGTLGRSYGVLNGLMSHSRRRGLSIVVCQIRQRWIIGRCEALDGFRDQTVQSRPACCGELLVEGVAHKRVCEGVPVRSARHVLYEARRDRFVEDVEQQLLRLLGERVQNRQVEFPANDRGQAEHAIAGLAEPAEAASNYLSYPFRQPPWIVGSTSPARQEGKRSRLREMPQHLTDEERIPFGPSGNQASEIGRTLSVRSTVR